MTHPYTRLYRSATAPTVSNDNTLGYEIGDIIVDQVANQSYQAFDVTTGAAVWVELTGGGGSYTNEQAQDAVGAMVDGTLVYTDATPLLSRAALTGDVTASAGSNTTTVTNASVISKVLTAFSAGAGTVASTDSILQAFQKVVGNIALKLTANSPITGATKTKITYDANGLVTSGADATTADIADSTNKRYVTDADLTDIGNLSGVNTGDQNLSGYQPLDPDLTAIAALSPADNDIIQRKSGAWTFRTVAQYIVDLGLGTFAFLSSLAHSSLTGIGANDHHAQDHAHNATDAQKLTQANSHQTPDTDSAAGSLHHTIGGSATQAAAGNHTHEVDQRADMWNDGEGNPADIASASADGTSAYGARRDHVHKGAAKAVILYPTHCLNNTVPASTTYYMCPFVDGAPSATERAMVVLRPGTVKNLYVRLAGTQPASGNIVIHIRKGAATNIITLTIPLSSVLGTYSNTADTAAVVAGDFLGIQIVNNATGASAALGFIAFEIECDP